MACAVLELVFEATPTTGQLQRFNRWLSGKVREPDGTEDTEDTLDLEDEASLADGSAPFLTEKGWDPTRTRWQSPRQTRGGDNADTIEEILAAKLTELGFRCRLRAECGCAGTNRYAEKITRQPWTYAPPLLTPGQLVRRVLDEGFTDELRQEATRMRDAIDLDPGRYPVRSRVMIMEEY